MLRAIFCYGLRGRQPERTEDVLIDDRLDMKGRKEGSFKNTKEDSGLAGC